MGIGIAPKPKTPSHRSVLASTLLLAGTQALGIFLAPGPKRGSFSDLRVNPGAASDTVPYIAGTPEITPHLITYFDFASKKVPNDVSRAEMILNAGLSGLAGYTAGGGTLVSAPPTAIIGLAEGTALGLITAGLGQLRTASYRYYCGFLYGVSHGMVDACTGVVVDDRLVSNGGTAGNTFLIDDPQAWGGDHVDGGIYALAKLIPGDFWPLQAVDPYIQSQLGINTASWSGKALFLIYGWSGFLESGYFASTPQGAPVVRPLRLRVRRIPSNLGTPEWANVNDGDANLAECVYEWLKSPTYGVRKLTDSHIDTDSFRTAAEKLFNKNLGITIEMNSATDVESALDTFCELGGMILYGRFNNGTVKLKVIERDYSIGSLSVFRRGPDGSASNLYNVIRVEGFTPGAWTNTANYWSFDYKDRDNRYQPTTRYVQDLANMLLTGRQRSLEQSIDGVSNGETAAFVGTREMRAGSYPRPPITLTVNRDGYLREPGDAIKYIDNVDNFTKILRIVEVQKLATDEESEITLVCMEDVFGVGASAFNPFVPPGFVLNLRHLMVFEDDINLTDGFGMQMVVPQGGGFADSFGLTDSVEISLGAPFSLSFSDTLNNWADAVAVGGPSELETWWIAGAEHEGSVTEGWVVQGDDLQPSSIQTGITDAHGRTYFTSGQQGRKDPLTNYTQATVRLRFRPAINATGDLIELRDTTSFPQCQLGLVNDGSFRVLRDATALETSATGLWSIDNWYYIEFKAVVDNSGSWVAKLWNDAGTLLGTLSGSGDTQNTANAFWNIVELGITAADTYIDDISIDVGGGLIDAPSRVETLYPSASGDLSDWPRGGTDTGANWDQVNEAIKDTTSYVQSSAADQFDSYNIDNRSITGTPMAVQVNAMARAGTAGSRTFKLLLRIGGVTYEGANTFTVTATGSDKKCSEVWDNNPATGNAWIDSEINSLQIGYRSTSTDVRIHQACAEVLVAT